MGRQGQQLLPLSDTNAGEESKEQNKDFSHLIRYIYELYQISCLFIVNNVIYLNKFNLLLNYLNKYCYFSLGHKIHWDTD